MNGLNYHDEMVHKMMDKEEARTRLITMAQNESLGLEREALIIGANALIDNENLWLEAHDKQIRAEAIEEFAHELKETFNCELPSNYSSTQPFFTLENARALVDMTLKEQNK